MMAIELALTKSGKVLAATEHSRLTQSTQKFAYISCSVLRIGRYSPRSHDTTRCLESQVKHRSEVDIKSECTAVLADHLSVLAEQSWIMGREHLGCGGSGSEYITKSIDRTALQINAGKERGIDALLTVAQKLPGLMSALDVPSKQDDAGRLHSF